MNERYQRIKENVSIAALLFLTREFGSERVRIKQIYKEIV